MVHSDLLAASETASSPTAPDYDGAWKNALDAYFPGFMALFWPDLHTLIDWRQAPVFMDKELQRLAPSTKRGRLHVDKLVRVRLRSGRDAMVLIHAEIQGRGSGFPERMFHYHVRLRERYSQYRLVSLAVMLHRRDGPSTQTYTYEQWGCTLSFTYPVVHLESWRLRAAELLALAPKNPFAVVVLAQLEANARRADAQRLVRKTALVRHLYEWQYNHDQIKQLFNIMDAMLILPESMENEFIDSVRQIEEEMHMTYVNTIERVALRRGKQEGIQQGAAEILTAQLDRKFGPLPDWAKTRMAQADEFTLNRWALQILDAQRIDDVFV